MSHLIVSFVIGFVSGYLLNKITSLFMLTLLVMLIAGYFLPGKSEGFYHYLEGISLFIKHYVSGYNLGNNIIAFIGKANLMLIAFVAGVMIGFRVG